MFQLPPLPYAYDALEPHISKATLEVHHDKHHGHYVETLNKLVTGTRLEGALLEEVIKETAGDAKQQEIFNNAGQAWNHTFYWSCMTPNGGGGPTGEIAKLIETTFGDTEAFAKEFKTAAETQFGSGWAWLVLDQGTLRIMKTSNADLPMAHGLTALLTLDVWEHAYYLDVKNERPKYVERYLEHLVNWDFANENLALALSETRAPVDMRLQKKRAS